MQSIALVGSYARNAAVNELDIDLVILTHRPQEYLKDLPRIKRFDVPEKHQTEDYGKLTSLRVWYQNGVEVEYGITMACSPVFAY